MHVSWKSFKKAKRDYQEAKQAAYIAQLERDNLALSNEVCQLRQRMAFAEDHNVNQSNLLQDLNWEL